MSYNKCVEKDHKYLDVDDSTEDGIGEGSKQGTISKQPKAKAFEIREVEKLNCNIITGSQSSGITERLYQRRKVRHEELMKKLANDLNEVNVKIEDNIRISSEEVKANIKNYKHCLAEKLRTLDTPEVASYHESVFLDIQKEADRMKSHQLRLVEDLHDDLRKLENFRSAENERIFQSSFQEIEKNAFILPYELQTFIEHEALKMNQLTLNNRRCYEDLKLKLTLVTEQTFKSFMDEVFCLKEKWLRYNMQEAVDQQHLRRKEEDKTFVVPLEPQIRLELKRHALAVKLTSDRRFSMVKVEDWFENIIGVSNTLESTKKMLIDLHQQVIKAVDKDMTGDVELKRSLLSLEVIEFEDRSIQPIVFESGIISEEYIELLELYWQDILRDVKAKLEDAIDYLVNFGELWNRHAERLCESNVLVLKAVEKLEENNIFPLQELEVKMNISLDALRQEYNEAKLGSLYATAVSSLDAIKEKMESDYVNEVTIIEDYYKMMNLEADVLSSEIMEFIYLKLPEVPEQELRVKPELDGAERKGVALCNKIDELLLGVTDLKLTKSQLRSSLEKFANNTAERVAWRAEDWVNSRIQEISRKYQALLEIHHKRYGRIRSQIYEVRQEEIYIHQRVFDEHKAGVENIYKKLNQTTENFYENSTEKLENCRNRVASIVVDAKKEDRAASVRSIQTQVQKQKVEFMSEVATKAEQSQQEIEFRISSVQQSNLKFMKSIKLFHENGNYDADEAKAYIASLENIDKESNNEAKSAIREARKRESEILQKASEIFDEAIRTLMQLDEELQFYESVKNVVHASKNDFQELSASLKADFDSLNSYCDFMDVCIADETTFLTPERDGLWFLLIAALYKNICNLFYKMEMPHWSDITVEETNGNYCEKVKVQISKGAKGKDAKADLCEDFREEIFDETVLTDTAPVFMNAVCKICWDYMDNLQRSGCAFYKNIGSKSLIRGDLLKSTYEEFAVDLCHMFRSFALQCENVWVQTMLAFLPLLGNVKHFLKTYFERRVREYAQNVLSALYNYDVELANCFNKNNCHMLSELQSLDKRLLPLHGYPRNSHLLSSLLDEVVMKTAELELSWEVFTKKYEIKLKSIRTTLCSSENEDYQTLKRLYTECKDSVIVEKLGKGLINLVEAIINRRGFVKKTEKSNSKIPADRNNTIVYSTGFGKMPVGSKSSPRHILKLHHLDGGLENTDAHFAQIKQIIRRETTYIPLEPEKSFGTDREDWMNLLEPKLGLLKNAEEFEDIMAPEMKRIKSVYREIKNFLESKTNFHKEVIFEWLDRWKENVAKSQELYAVKYPHADDPSDDFSVSSKEKGKFQQKQKIFNCAQFELRSSPE